MIDEQEVTQTNPETVETESIQESAQDTPEYYTAEEMKAAGMNIDLNRVQPELREMAKELKKSLQADYTRKTQALSEEKKRIQQESQPRSNNPEDVLFQSYLTNPRGVISGINQRIAQLEEVEPYDENYKAARREIAGLQAAKDDLKERRTEWEAAERKKEAVQRTDNYTLLKEHAESMGFDENDLMNPKILKLVKKTFEVENAAATAKQKAVKQEPMHVEHPGNGDVKPQAQSLDRLRKIAEKDGSDEAWAKYFEAKDAINSRR